jgi:hypothetical protein
MVATNALGLFVLFDGPQLGRWPDLTAFRDSAIRTKFRESLIQANLMSMHC